MRATGAIRTGAVVRITAAVAAVVGCAALRMLVTTATAAAAIRSSSSSPGRRVVVFSVASLPDRLAMDSTAATGTGSVGLSGCTAPAASSSHNDVAIDEHVTAPTAASAAPVFPSFATVWKPIPSDSTILRGGSPSTGADDDSQRLTWQADVVPLYEPASPAPIGVALLPSAAAGPPHFNMQPCPRNAPPPNDTLTVSTHAVASASVVVAHAAVVTEYRTDN